MLKEFFPVFIFILFSISKGHAQNINFEDGFEDGNFTDNPTWAGDTSQYNIIDGNPNFLLQLDGNSTAGDISYLSAPSTSVVGSWEFYINIGTDPSNGNNITLFLMSNIADLEGNINGYALQAGESGDDDVFYIVRYDSGSEEKIVISGTTNISAGGKFRVNVTREAGGLWSLEVGRGYDGTLSQEGGIAIDSTYTSTRYFGVRTTYTSSNAQDYSFDFKIDLTPFTLTDATGQNAQVDVTFNRPYDQSTVQTDDFILNDDVGPSASISFPSSDVVRLNYDSALAANEYLLTAQDILDQNGELLAAGASAEFIVFNSHASGDVIINEFLYDQSKNPEYVEIKNSSNKFLNLQGWKLGDASGDEIISMDTLILRPNAFLVISEDTTALSATYGPRPYVEPASVPSLNNDGDVIKILTGDETLVDSLQYNQDWGGNDVSLERRSDTTPAIYKENFGDSPHPKDGTPGITNEVAQDAEPPNLDDFIITGNQTIDMDFSERLENSNAINPANYKLDNGISIGNARQTASDSVRLSLSSPLQNGTEYQLAVTNQQDIFGNTASSIDTSFTFYKVSRADSGNSFINEFTYDPPEGSTEYIELYNPTKKSLNLKGCTIHDNTGNHKRIIDSQYIVPPDSYVVLAPDQTLLQKNPNMKLIAMGSRFPSLNNSGDDIVLQDASGEQLDSLRYSSAWGGDEIALERRTTEVGPFQSNFGNAPNGFGTPGETNKIAHDSSPPKIIAFSTTGNKSLEYSFSEQVEKQSATSLGTYSISTDIKISNASLKDGNTVRLNLSNALENNTTYTTTISGLNDLFGNTINNRDTTFTYFKVAKADSGDVLINEFTYDPPEGSTEYIELVNPTSKSFNLEGWTINDNTGKIQAITHEQFIIPPDSFVVIAPDPTLLLNKPNIALISMGNGFPSLNNNGDGIVLRDSTGQRLDSLIYRSDWGGDEIALERRTTAVNPICANFGIAPNGFGTPGLQNQIGADNTPPALKTFTILENQLLEFVFSEQVEESSATNAANYSLSDGIKINSTILAGKDTVRIKLSNPLQNNTEYTASINGVNDPFGNMITALDTTFTYYQVTAVDSADVFINEFIYDPPSGQTEYIEIFNPTSSSLNLQNWTINDNTGHLHPITDDQYIIPPNSHIVIAPDKTLLQTYPNILLVTMGNAFPSFNNSGDDIVLRDGSGQLLDSLRYTSAWGGDEVALERRTTNVAPLRANFGDAPNNIGTPGTANNISLDKEPPALNSLRILDRTTFRLIFSESITAETATQKANYAISPNPGIQLISAVQDTVTLFLSQQLQSEQTYRVRIQGLMDLFGNTIAETSPEATYISFSDARPGNIVINEFRYNSGNAGDPEFVELFNPTDKNFDLSNWAIGDAGGRAIIPSGVQLRSGSYLVLSANRSWANSLDEGIYLSGFPSLNNDQDIIYLQDENEVSIDSLSYAAKFGGNVGGKSAERKDPEAASNDPANFATSTAKGGSTPGVQNSVFGPDGTPPAASFARIFPNGDVEVRFSEFITLDEEMEFSINGQPLSVDAFIPHQGNRIFLNTPQSLEQGRELTLVVKNLTDVSGNASSSVEIPIAQLLQPGDVTVNEILYDPISDSEDNRPDQSEYIELRNTRDYAVSLEGITLHDAPDENGEVRTLAPVSTRSKYIAAQGTVLIYADEGTVFKQSPTAKFFELKNQAINTIIRIDRSSLSLSSTDDAIYLTGKEGTEIDSVFYDETWQNPNLVATDGIALERINPEGPSNDESNWGSSTNDHGGTPNNENSLFQEPGNDDQNEIGISFNPNPFSPDGDGTDDKLFINYKLGQSDYLITVTIYDRYGRKVRELVDGKPAGFEGSLIWDGLKDNGNRNRIGIYIVIFEAFDSTSGRNKTFKKTVVLARRLN